MFINLKYLVILISFYILKLIRADNQQQNTKTTLKKGKTVVQILD